MNPDRRVAQRWTRWHSDDWTLVVMQTDNGEFFYNASKGDADDPMKPASSKIDAQHRAEDVVRNSGHRCIARCSFWVPDMPEDLD